MPETRRMQRSIEGDGVDGEFYVGDDREDTIINYNRPPGEQPGLWCQWQLQRDNQTIMWDGGEKFYYYTEWIEYIISKILAPRGYIVNGEVEWSGEDPTDVGKIVVKNNKVKELVGRVVYD